MNTQDKNRDIVHSSAYNPFPEPQTIPSGWDISGLLSVPEPAPDTQADDSAKVNHLIARAGQVGGVLPPYRELPEGRDRAKQSQVTTQQEIA